MRKARKSSKFETNPFYKFYNTLYAHNESLSTARLPN